MAHSDARPPSPDPQLVHFLERRPASTADNRCAVAAD
jgi:hypothetical protein